MSRIPSNQLFQLQQKKLVGATFKQATISSINLATRTVNVFFIENPQTIVRNIPVATHINLATTIPGMLCRVDIFNETKPGSMAIAYTY